MIDALRDAIDALSKAHGADELFAAFRTIRNRIRKERRQDTEANSLGAVVIEAVNYRDKLKSDGVAAEDLDAGLEAVVRARWVKPYDRTVPWRYICELCGDTGLQMFVCRPGMRCNGVSTRADGPRDRPGNHLRLCVGSATAEHDYGEPCVCARGDRFRAKQVPSGGDDFRSAVKSKPKPMERWGRS